jgi:signal transduction histidine kinase
MDQRVLSVVVIDDDPTDLEIIQHCLLSIRAWEIEVHPFHDAESALAGRLRVEGADLILLDYLLGRETGVDVLERFAREGIDAPVIGLTGHGSEEVAMAMMARGAYDYLQKGILTEKNLARIIKNTLERKRLERELEGYRRVKERFDRDLRRKNDEMLGFQHTLSQEIGSPLASALECLNMLLQELAGPLEEEQRMFVESAHDSCQVIQRHIGDLLDATRLETGDFRLDIHSASLAALVRKAIVTMSHQAREKGLHITHDLAGDLPLLRVDPRRILQVLVNLVDNSVKFTEAGGHIVIRGRLDPEDEERAIISVEDNGIGIEPAKLDRIFARDLEVLEEGPDRQAGLGLGLDICREIIDRHGGRIRASSRPGMGTTFTFTLPLATAPTGVGPH